MTDRTDTIRGLQRAARAEGRRDASTRDTSDVPRRSRVTELRDDLHFQVLRVTEAARSLPRRTRRVAAGTAVATILLITVIGAVAGADQRPGGGDGAHRASGEPPATGPARGTHRDETLTGTDGNDVIDGRAGSDVLLGARGKDVLGGATGDDVLHGGDGDDVLWAGPGRDVLIGADGDDQLRAPNLDGKVDRLHCGAGDDVAWVAARSGKVEDLTSGCERVNVINVRTVRAARVG